jgi:hypothetical protein
MREPERSLGLSRKHAYSAPQRCMTCDSLTRMNQQLMCARIRFLLCRVFRNLIGHPSLCIATLIVSDPPQKQLTRFLRHPCSATCWCAPRIANRLVPMFLASRFVLPHVLPRLIAAPCGSRRCPFPLADGWPTRNRCIHWVDRNTQSEERTA